MFKSILFGCAAVVLIARPAAAQIEAMPASNQLGAIVNSMTGTIKRCATPIMRIFAANAGSFCQTNSPDFKNNDVPYEFETTATTLKGVLLAPVSGHVPFGSRDVQLMQKNAAKYAAGNITEVKLNGKIVATVAHNGDYVAQVPIDLQLQPGKNTVVMFQRNPTTGESAHVGGFPMGRQFNITVKTNGRSNGWLGRARPRRALRR